MASVSTNNPISLNFGPLARLSAFIRAKLDQMNTRAELERLSERELNDIGLCRADIDDVVKNYA